MSNYRKNLMVGLTVLSGLVLLCYMLLKFGSEPAKWFTPKKMTVQLQGSSAEGIFAGSVITYLGVAVGQVADVQRTPDNTQIIMSALIDEKNPPPANVIGFIHTQFVGNGGSISLEVRAGEKPQGQLATGSVVNTVYLGNSLLPPEIAQFVEEMRKKELVTHLDQAIQAITKQIDHAGQVMDSFDATVNDPAMRADLKAALAHVRVVTENAQTVSTDLTKFTGRLDKLTDQASDTLTKSQAHIDVLAKQVDDRMEQMSKIIATAQAIVDKVDQGKGTAGMLVNDPKLYESLVMTTRDLDLTIKDLKHLAEQWQQEGLYLKLSK